MKRLEAEVLRGLLIKHYSKVGLVDKVANIMVKHSVSSDMDDWVLSVDELMELSIGNVPMQFMAQIEKLAKILGCSTEDAQKLAVGAFGSIKIINQ